MLENKWTWKSQKGLYKRVSSWERVANSSPTCPLLIIPHFTPYSLTKPITHTKKKKKEKIKEKEAKRARMDQEKTKVCVLDASSYVGFWILKGLLSRGYEVHAAIQKHGK